MSRAVFSFVVPIYDEAETLPELVRRLTAVMDELEGDAEVVLVDDGSRDESYTRICEIADCDHRYKAIRLSRNFGHQIAITAGLDYASGDAVVVMDADLQDPPEVVLEMVARWREGYDVIYAVRSERAGETRFKQWSAKAFYGVFKRLTDLDMPAEVGDFRLVDRRALEAFKTMRESNRYVRGMFSWIGYRQAGIPYVRDSRYAGATKYPLRKMLRFAADAIVSFSNVPLRLALTCGFVVAVVSLLLGLAAIVFKAFGYYSIPGIAGIVVVTSFLGGVQLLLLGVMGEYLARIHEEVKGRPIYLVDETLGFAELEASSRRASARGMDVPHTRRLPGTRGEADIDSIT
jgi:polyisoprenyl-phosphate glycosyltransferase